MPPLFALFLDGSIIVRCKILKEIYCIIRVFALIVKSVNLYFDKLKKDDRTLDQYLYIE